MPDGNKDKKEPSISDVLSAVAALSIKVDGLKASLSQLGDKLAIVAAASANAASSLQVHTLADSIAASRNKLSDLEQLTIAIKSKAGA